MTSPLDPLVEIIHSAMSDSWKDDNTKALAALFGTRYQKRAEKSVTLRAPDMKGSDAGIPYASYIHPSNADAGAFGGMCFVIFPVEGAPCLVAMGIGTQGLAPDEAILGRPGHARKMQAVCTWLNHQSGGGAQVAWAKQDPTRVDIDVPDSIQHAWTSYERAFKKYGRVLYAIYKPTDDRAGTIAALKAMLDIMFQERGHTPLKEYQDDALAVQSAWFAHLMPLTTRDEVLGLLKTRRYVVIHTYPISPERKSANRTSSNAPA